MIDVNSRVGQWLTRTNDENDYFIKGKNYKIVGKVQNRIYVKDESGGIALIRKFYDWKPAPKTWETLEVGDILKNKDGCHSKILEVGQNSFLLSYSDDLNYACGWYTAEEAIDKGFTIEQAETPDKLIQINIGENKICVTKKQATRITNIINQYLKYRYL